MKIDSFFSSILFGAVAAVGVVFAQHLFSPVLGSATVQTLYLALAMVVYAALIASSLRNRLGKLAVAGLGALFVLGMASGTHAIAIGLTIVLSLVRSGFDRESRTPRGWCAEGLLGVAALVFASVLYSPSWLGSAAGLWGYALVQSLYFQLPALRTRPRHSMTGDAFDRARERILVLLDDA